jgi:hypothetical protein
VKILFTADIPDGYVVQTYGALVRGLGELFDIRVPTREQRASCRSYQQLCQATFGQDDVDVVFVEPVRTEQGYIDPYAGGRDSTAVRVTLLSDFWYLYGPMLEQYMAFMDAQHITYLLTLYPLAFDIYEGTPIASKLRWLPPTFDPKVFNDWALPKEFDIGFVGSGVLAPDAFYPERTALHRAARHAPQWRYYTREHPGYGRQYSAEDLRVGRGYSQDINRCRGFLASGGRPNLPLARYFETMASAAIVFGIEPVGAAQLGLVDGETYVAVTPETLHDKMDYYLSRPDEEARIRRNGYRLALARHSCFQRALDFHAIIEGRGGLP